MENSNGGVQSVARIFALIEVLCAHPKGASLQTISAESGLPKSTAHRLLSSLVSLGYAVQDSFSTHYRLTMKMFELSSGLVNDMDIMSVAKPHLDKLFAECPHTLIGASGMDVGLPNGQMGNSEVGHTNIGAGRIVYQELTRITKSIVARA